MSPFFFVTHTQLFTQSVGWLTGSMIPLSASESNSFFRGSRKANGTRRGGCTTGLTLGSMSIWNFPSKQPMPWNTSPYSLRMVCLAASSPLGFDGCGASILFGMSSLSSVGALSVTLMLKCNDTKLRALQVGNPRIAGPLAWLTWKTQRSRFSWCDTVRLQVPKFWMLWPPNAISLVVEGRRPGGIPFTSLAFSGNSDLYTDRGITLTSLPVSILNLMSLAWEPSAVFSVTNAWVSLSLPLVTSLVFLAVCCSVWKYMASASSWLAVASASWSACTRVLCAFLAPWLLCDERHIFAQWFDFPHALHVVPCVGHLSARLCALPQLLHADEGALGGGACVFLWSGRRFFGLLRWFVWSACTTLWRPCISSSCFEVASYCWAIFIASDSVDVSASSSSFDCTCLEFNP